MKRHAESNNLVLLAVLLELERVVALVAVDNEQSILSNTSPLCMLVEVLQPLETKLVRRPAVLRDCNNPVVRSAILLVLGREVMLAGKDDEGWERPPRRVDALDDRGSLPIALLDGIRPSSTV